ncbi:MAG: FHA domain-containing protein [Planctomycetes bacterium]|nr:FHA domain-containing protein [Planctomycetota bacterium]
MNEAETVLLQLIQASLRGNETPDEIERVALAAVANVGLPEEVGRHLADVLNASSEDQPSKHPPMETSPANLEADSEAPIAVDESTSFREAPNPAFDDASPVPVSSNQATIPASASSFAVSSTAAPQLLVDWGTGLRIGWHVCAECQLTCPPGYESRPSVRVRVDPRLDQEDETSTPNVKCEEPGLWSFHIPFALTTGEKDCRPGQYLIEIFVVFPQVAPPKARFFHCSIRFNVLDPTGTTGPTLEIEGEGQSMLNLQGRDLNSFARVVLRGRGTSVVNVQETLFGADAHHSDTPPAGEIAGRDNEAHQFAYQLRLDVHRGRRLPWASTRFVQRQPTDAAALVTDDGRRVLLLARRSVKLGRSRDNGIVLRFLPRSAQHDAWSRRISRQHVSCRLSDEGLRISDLGSTEGSQLNGETLRNPQLLTAQDSYDDLQLDLAAGDKVEMPFRIQLRMIGPSDADCGHGDDELVQSLCSDALGEPAPPLWRLARSSRIDAVRMDRVNNLPNQETYVLVYRHATLGHCQDAAICFAGEDLEAFHARVLQLGGQFWLQNLSCGGRATIDGHPLREAETVPLTFGMAMTLGDLRLRYLPFGQMYL